MGIFKRGGLPEEDIAILARMLCRQAVVSSEMHSHLFETVRAMDNDAAEAEEEYLRAFFYLEYLYYYLCTIVGYANKFGGQAAVQRFVIRLRPYFVEYTLDKYFSKADKAKRERMTKEILDGAETLNNYYVDNLNADSKPYEQGSPDFLLSMRLLSHLDDAPEDIQKVVFQATLPIAHEAILAFFKSLEEFKKQLKKALK